MNDSFWATVIVAISVLAVIYGWQWRRWKQEHDDADEVTKRAEIIAELLKTNTAVAAQVSRDMLEHLISSTNITHHQLEELAKDTKIVHALVNSRLTTEIQSRLDANQALLIAVQALNVMKTSHGRDLTPEDHTAVEAIKQKIRELESVLKDRQEKQATIDQ